MMSLPLIAYAAESAYENSSSQSVNYELTQEDFTQVENEVDDFNDSDIQGETSEVTLASPNVGQDSSYPQTQFNNAYDSKANSRTRVNTTEAVNVNELDDSQVDISEGVQDPQAVSNLNTFERQKLNDRLDSGLSVKNVPLNAVSPETLRTFVQVIDLVRRDYVEPVSDELLFNNAIAGMLEKLDPHAEFLDAEAYDNLRAFTEGDVGHVGLEVEFNVSDSQWVIKDIAPNSPAQLNGLQVGDYIHKINDTKLNAGMHEVDILQLLSGIAGTQVDLEVSNAGRKKHIVTLQRNIAKHQQLDVELLDSLVYIKLPVFQNDTAIQMIESLNALDTPITGVLIDLRNNPGGVLTSAVEVASLFMDNTDVVQIRGRETPLKVLSTHGVPILKDLPVVILQNRHSASASEVLASSLQISGRAVITGERSQGKGSIQAILPLDEQQAVKMTVAHYLGADGSQIEGVGITPDVKLSENSVSTWKQQALSLLLEQDRPLGIIFNTTEDGIAVEENY